MTETTLEQRVERIEKHLRKKSWLDEDSGYTLDLNAPFPLPLRIFGWFVCAIPFGLFGLLIYAKVAG